MLDQCSIQVDTPIPVNPAVFTEDNFPIGSGVLSAGSCNFRNQKANPWIDASPYENEDEEDEDIDEERKLERRATGRINIFEDNALVVYTRCAQPGTNSAAGAAEDHFIDSIIFNPAKVLYGHNGITPATDAAMVKDPADYRWSSYGEGVGGGKTGNGKKSREGLVRAYFCDQGVGFDAERWREASRLYRRLMRLALECKSGKADVVSQRRSPTAATTLDSMAAQENDTVLPDLKLVALLRCRVRYFTDGAVVGSKAFVNEASAAARGRFTEKRKDGARRMKGSGKAAAGVLWSVRNLRVRLG